MDARAAMRHEDGVFQILLFVGRRIGVQLDPAQNLMQDHPHLDYGEGGAEAARSAAKREPRRRAQARTEHAIRVFSENRAADTACGGHCY